MSGRQRREGEGDNKKCLSSKSLELKWKEKKEGVSTSEFDTSFPVRRLPLQAKAADNHHQHHHHRHRDKFKSNPKILVRR